MEFDLEEGELSNDSDSYTPLQRPSNYSTAEDKRFSKNLEYESDNEQLSSTDSDSDDSDTAYKRTKKAKKTKVVPKKHASTSNVKQRKKYDIWSTRAQEDVLSETLNSCEVTEKDRSRDVESYDYSLSRRYKDETVERVNNKRTRDDRRRTKLRLTQRKEEEEEKDVKTVPRYILDLNEATDECTDEELAIDTANKLCEEKEDLILKIVTIIGQENTRRIFNEVKRIEADGGMMIMNQTRRRTPGGIFLFLVKHDSELTAEQRQTIFENDKLNYKEFRKQKKKQKVAEMKAKIAASGNVKLPDLLTRADLVQKLNKEAWSPKESNDQEDVVNPPPTPETDGHTSGDGLEFNEGNPAVIHNKVESYEDDFLEITTSHDMDLF